MRLYHLIEQTRAEGPGNRLCIWVQGCPHHCKGCYLPQTWDPMQGTESTSRELIALVNKNREDLDGITLLGGEPFAQAEELAEVAAAAHGLGLNVLTFTGFLYEDLLHKAECAALLSETDLLIDGPYLAAQRDFSRPLAGSSNQRFLYLTQRISEEEMKNYRNRVEVRIDQNGILRLNGMTDFDQLTNCINLI